MVTNPSVGRWVHYVSAGSADGKHPSVCRAALVTEVQDATVIDGDPEQQKVGLMVVNPTGLHFRPLTDGGATYDDAASAAPMTWHWPERV